MTRSLLAPAALLLCAGFVAGVESCRKSGEPSGARPAMFPAASAGAPAPSSPIETAAANATTGAATATASAPGPSSAAALALLMACAAPRAQITNAPAGGRIFNNAMTSADAGRIDRAQGILDALAERSQAMRCCFEPWLAGGGGPRGRVLMRVAVDPNGTATSAEVDPARSDIRDPTTLACLVALAKSVAFPQSPTNKETTLEYPIAVDAPLQGPSRDKD